MSFPTRNIPERERNVLKNTLFSLSIVVCFYIVLSTPSNNCSPYGKKRMKREMKEKKTHNNDTSKKLHHITQLKFEIQT